MSSENENDPFFVSDIYFFEIPQWRTATHRAQSWDLTDYGMAKIRLYGTKFCTLKFVVNGAELGESRIFQYPSSALQPVVDSNRYFVLKLLWTQTDKLEDIGICFYDRKQSKEFISLLIYHLPTTEEFPNLKEETESSRSGSSNSNSVASSKTAVAPASSKDSGISSAFDRDLEELRSRFSILSTLNTSSTLKETTKQEPVSPKPFAPTTTIEKTDPKENSISVIHQTIPVIPRTRVNFQTRIIKEDVDDNIVFFDYHYPEFRIITNNYSKIDSDTLKELRNFAPKQLIRPGLKRKYEA